MIEGVITAIAVSVTAFFFGLLVGSSRETSLDKKNYQLQCQNQILTRDIKKQTDIIAMIKNNPDSVDLSHEGVIIFYNSKEEFDYEKFFRKCLE